MDIKRGSAVSCRVKKMCVCVKRGGEKLFRGEDQSDEKVKGGNIGLDQRGGGREGGLPTLSLFLSLCFSFCSPVRVSFIHSHVLKEIRTYVCQAVPSLFPSANQDTDSESFLKSIPARREANRG